MNTTTESTVSLGEIERKAAAFAKARSELSAVIEELRQELDAAKRGKIRTIKSLAAEAAAKEADLRSAIESGAELFARPKTLTLHGIKVGFRSSEGKIVVEDEEAAVKLIRKHFSDQEELLVRVKESLKKEGLKTLKATELAKIGARIEGAGDQVVLSAVDDEVERLVGKLIEDMVDVILEEERAAA